MSVQERIEAAYLGPKRSALFALEQFLAAELGTADEVASALKALVDESFLSARATLVCAFGHEFYGGSLPDALSKLRSECSRVDCESHALTESEKREADFQARVVVRYSMTKPWKMALEAQQKKTPQMA
ncbi:hypothetical protein [Myxococcus sp. AB025B]|uniref:hypothetical protein n=1 Tax=Myxococcus sp. AB025B TaxID=2562794 RepID=UPI0011425179|nr:hypothetical protein [Myxococcus sp. AB025B]